MNRRELIKGLALITVSPMGAGQSNALVSQAVPTLYYMDGYHGGVRGHMPEGAWRDILNALRLFKDWKISLDIEPMSWQVLRATDPQAFHEIAAYLRDDSVGARIEMVGGTFSQPYGWAISGESNIRQLQYGLKVIQESFPRLSVTTYAVQEPCWASCLPQILRSLGFKAAVLRDASTAWGGFSRGMDAEVVRWTGPDGSQIAAVPRYACEDVTSVYATESVDATLEFVRKCIGRGIAHPAGMSFQDLGWAAKPQVSAPYIRYATWREYFESIAIKPVKQWTYGIEDLLVTLPWGQPDLQQVARQVRASENRLVHAERIASIACLERGMQWPAERLTAAWVQLMYMQSHDAWICASTGEGRQSQVFQTQARGMAADEMAESIIVEAKLALSAGSSDTQKPSAKTRYVRIVNTTAMAREEVVEVSLATDRGTLDVRVEDEKNIQLPCQVQVRRRYYTQNTLTILSETHASAPDDVGISSIGEQINNAVVLFRAEVPSMGYATYRITDMDEQQLREQRPTPCVTTESTGVWTIESDLYRIKIDPRCGGAITELYAKAMEREFCSEGAEAMFNEYRAYFIEQKRWCRSTESPASIDMVEAGPLRVTVKICGSVGEVPFETLLAITEGQPRIDLRVRFRYEKDTWIGQPIDIEPNQREVQGRRSQNNGRWKLQVLFPAALKPTALYKNAAFDVCRSCNSDTFFEEWKDIKQNIIVNWVDVFDEAEQAGLAVFCDHTTGYNWGPSDPLGLVLGWAWDGGFWWTKRPLRGTEEVRYAFMPHKGRWDAARLTAECERQANELEAQIIDGDTGVFPLKWSLLQFDDPGIYLSSMSMSDQDALIRVWNAESDKIEQTIRFHRRFRQVNLIDLDGTETEKLTVYEDGRDGCAVKVRIPRFAFRTLMCVREPESSS